jgi:hypothetical protein
MRIYNSELTNFIATVMDTCLASYKHLGVYNLDLNPYISPERHYFQRFQLTCNIILKSPQRCLQLVVVVGLVRLCDPESNAGSSLNTSRATHAGKVKG